NVINEDSLANLTTLNPAPFGSKDSIKYITPENYEHNLELLADCDLIIEAVPEPIDNKETLYTKISTHIKENAILASNT
ncbi:3-hydroxyacyl-CoA dehydrogenase NAD-binding domain-containing protein, partial [Francisella tularensis]|uniref:3-hydroxyacyl-CoA dehydrogenase NAD-binding domain-containing protein n=1 Tax=Francisella tularensis TaxID=263 RepID=UPI002381A947